jgi:hypothetical protein
MLLLGIGPKAASGQSRLSSRSPSPYRRGHRAGKPDLRLRWMLALHRRGRFLGPLARSNESRYKARHRDGASSVEDSMQIGLKTGSSVDPLRLNWDGAAQRPLVWAALVSSG